MTLPRLADLSWPEAQRLANALLVVPVGATEQHGPHLPLSTDTDLAVALADALMAARPDVVVAPELAFGSSGEHAGFAGTVSIGQHACELTLVELGRSAADTFAGLLFICTHGGNAEPVRRAVALLQAEGRDDRAWWPDWAVDAHAGHAETSLMLALHAAKVSRDQAQRGTVAPIEELIPALRAGGVGAVSPNGILGDPLRASVEAGHKLFGRALANLIDTLDAWR